MMWRRRSTTEITRTKTCRGWDLLSSCHSSTSKTQLLSEHARTHVVISSMCMVGWELIIDEMNDHQHEPSHHVKLVLQLDWWFGFSNGRKVQYITVSDAIDLPTDFYLRVFTQFEPRLKWVNSFEMSKRRMYDSLHWFEMSKLMYVGFSTCHEVSLKELAIVSFVRGPSQATDDDPLFFEASLSTMTKEGILTTTTK